ncbi:MAG TPA: RsmF rRNA methyltransferase first C-terminal domain-containing protein [Bacteroidales bacterium]|nr:RsmF rRNA methyltransferase first C-terminal domain-containing protein [Bacteroidales bacterium]
MFPEAFIERIAGQKTIDSDILLKALGEPSSVSIRINRSKWRKAPQDGENVPWCETGFYLHERPSYTLDPLFHAGCYYPQEASSMFLEEAIKQTAGTLGKVRVLDLCGAPGGKSTHLADLISADGLLIANDVIRSRAVTLAETVTKWGKGNTLVTQSDPALFGRLSGYFDIILVDAPCSGEGMFRSGTALKEWSVRNTLHCAERQKRILMDVWPALKENGILVYSTCTFNPGENEENIKWLIGKHEAEIIRLNITEFKGITEIDYQGIYGYGFYPDKIRGEGFFISVIRKTSKQETYRLRSQVKNILKPGKADLDIAGNWTNISKDRLLKWGDEVFAVPCGFDDYLHLFHNLKIVKAGTKLFAVKKNNFLPSHELALSDKLLTDAFPREEIDLSRAISYLRRDNFALTDAPRGWNILTYRGINLGFVNNIGSRVNNYFPVEWRIRMNWSESGVENIIKWNNN